MNKSIKSNSIILAVENIYPHIKSLHKQEITDKTLLKNLKVISNFFEVSSNMASLLAIIIYDQIIGDGHNLRKILREMELTPTLALEVHKEVKTLRLKGWLINTRPKLSRYKDCYELSKGAFEAVMVNKKEKLNANIPNCQEDALIEINAVFGTIIEEFDAEDMVEMLMFQMMKYTQFPVFQMVLTDKNLSDSERLILLWMSSEFMVKRIELFDITWIVERVFRSPFWLHKIQKRICINGYLLEKNYLTCYEMGMIDMANMSLGSAIIEKLDISFHSEKTRPVFNLCVPIYPDNINDTALFFNQDNKRHLEEIKSLTSVSSYESIVSTFKSEGLPLGISILISGNPGTGKTESVKQIAKEQNRLLLMVDISKFKSMWMGETEKNIKKIFKEYEAACAFFDTKPILLFNEADAILGKRQNVQSNIDQTMNNIQNILLQQMEDFEGILIATTNLVSNLDAAFDRRFILKFSFELPDKTTRIQIVQDKLPNLSLVYQKHIAEKFNLTGAQIQNIKRRLIAQKILHGDFEMELNWLENIISDEIKTKQTPVIGFVANY
jgi:hypothetical protein